MANLLVVEDEFEILSAFRTLQKELMTDIIFAEVHDMASFDKTFDPAKFDAVLLDIRLRKEPRSVDIDEIGGVRIAEGLEEKGNKVPIVVLTAWPETGDWRKRLLKLQCVKTILKKPVSAEELILALRNAIESNE